VKIKQAANKFKKNLEESKKDEKTGIYNFLAKIHFLQNNHFFAKYPLFLQNSHFF